MREVRAHAGYYGIDDVVDLIWGELAAEGRGGEVMGAEGAEEGGLHLGVGFILLVDGQLGQEGGEIGGRHCLGTNDTC